VMTSPMVLFFLQYGKHHTPISFTTFSRFT
jgi:hypothetical protein